MLTLASFLQYCHTQINTNTKKVKNNNALIDHKLIINISLINNHIMYYL